MMADTSMHPIPAPTRLSKPFWDAVAQKKFLLQYDPVAGKYQWWPRPVSIYSGRRNLEWREVSGKGKLASWSLVQTALFAYADIIPYVLAAIELDEGVRVMARLTNVKDEELKAGMRLKVAFEDLPDGAKMYVFEPDR
jgi:uncharacterized OB-fold protein